MDKGTELRMAVCDDERHVHDTVEKLMEIYAGRKKVCCKYYHFFSAQELLLLEDSIDFLLLDIDMPVMDGIEAAHILNKRGIDYKIIMLTSKTERFKEAFKIGAFRFVTKPISEDELFEAVDEVRERMLGMEMVKAYRDGIRYEIVQREILYFMADGNTIRIFTEDAEYRSEQSLKQWIEELDQRLFFACHKSYVVNLGKIVKTEKDILYLTSGEKIPIARRSRKEFPQKFLMYDIKGR